MYSFEAKVIRGEGRGRMLGFPTINLDRKTLDVDYGVYSVNVFFKNKKYIGILHYGPKKTFNKGVSVEIYIKDFDSDVYDSDVKIKLIKKIRDVKKFNSGEELKKQIKEDIKYV